MLRIQKGSWESIVLSQCNLLKIIQLFRQLLPYEAGSLRNESFQNTVEILNFKLFSIIFAEKRKDGIKAPLA